MDSLINSLSKFNLTKDVKSLEQELEFIMDTLQNKKLIEESEEEEENEEWENIKENYSKLRCLDTLLKEQVNTLDITNLHTNEESIFVKATFPFILANLMEKIDQSNIHYLESIDWEGAKMCVENSEEIERLLRISINMNNPYHKMLECLEAYNLLIPVIEKFRGEESTYDTIRDQEFVQQIDSLIRKKS